MLPAFQLPARLALFSKPASFAFLTKAIVPALAHSFNQPIAARRMTSTNGDGDGDKNLDEWKTRVPYRIHDNENFDVKYEASCHCGRVKYQLSRDKPLDAKYCHCSTCQRLHGQHSSPSSLTSSARIPTW